MKKISKLFVLPLVVLLGSCASEKDEPTVTPPQEQPTEEDVISDVSISLTGEERNVATGVSEFGFRLLSAVAAEEDDNFCVSPYSAEVYLAMLANGYDGEAQRLIASALMGDEADVEVLNSYNEKMNRQLPVRDTGATVRSANSLWLVPDAELQPETGDVLSDVYSAEVKHASLSDMSIVSAVNQWVSDNTRGLITRVLDAPCDPGVRAILFNTLYYNAPWVKPFDEAQTVKLPFLCADGHTTQADMMKKNELMEYYVGNNFKGISLYMGTHYGYSFSMILPDEDVDFNTFLRTFNYENWHKRKGNEAIVELWMPRFDVRYSFELESPLAVLGLGSVLESPLTKMLQGASIAAPTGMQQVVFSISEKGAEAAAVTGGIISGAGRPGYAEIEFNRPFVYLLQEESTGTILFIGAVRNL